MTIAEFFSIVQDISVSAAAIVTAVVACLGLRSWQAELSGRANFDAARALIKATYNVRDILDGCRHPWLRPQEFPDEYFATANPDAADRAKGLEHVYWSRWDKVFQFTQEFDSASLEAEALWGAEIEEPSKKLRTCVHELRAAIEAYIKNAYCEGEDFRADKEFAQLVTSRINISTDRSDPLSVKLKDAIQEIEGYVRPHLARS